MPHLSFMSAEGSAIGVEGNVGRSVMKIRRAQRNRLDVSSPNEMDMLKFGWRRRLTSPLACEIRLKRRPE
jgi:hypothetical protein